MPIAECPECGAEIHVDEEVDKGDLLHCDDCEMTLEVVGLDPIEFDLAADEIEDYDEEDDY